MAPEIAGIPEIYVERFVEAYEAFVDQVRTMVQQAVEVALGRLTGTGIRMAVPCAPAA